MLCKDRCFGHARWPCSLCWFQGGHRRRYSSTVNHPSKHDSWEVRISFCMATIVNKRFFLKAHCTVKPQYFSTEINLQQIGRNTKQNKKKKKHDQAQISVHEYWRMLSWHIFIPFSGKKYCNQHFSVFLSQRIQLSEGTSSKCNTHSNYKKWNLTDAREYQTSKKVDQHKTRKGQYPYTYCNLDFSLDLIEMDRLNCGMKIADFYLMPSKFISSSALDSQALPLTGQFWTVLDKYC